MRRIFFVAMALLVVLVNGCQRHNPNTDPPPPYDDKPVSHHRFDGGETDPYSRPGEQGGGGGEGKSAE